MSDDTLKKYQAPKFQRTDMDFTDEPTVEVPISKTVLRDGIQIPTPTQKENASFQKWLADNKVREPFHPDQHYDYVGAFRAGVGRAAGDEGHFTDQFKLPGHESFSDESQYAKGKFAKAAGHWDYDHPDKDGQPTFNRSKLAEALLKTLLRSR